MPVSVESESIATPAAPPSAPSESVFRLFISEVFSSLETSKVGESNHFEEVEEVVPQMAVETLVLIVVVDDGVVVCPTPENLAVNEIKDFYAV